MIELRTGDIAGDIWLIILTEMEDTGSDILEDMAGI